MDSFAAYVKKARDFANTTVSKVTDPSTQKWFLMTVAIPAALFVILSPGLLLNLPPNSETFCRKQVPLPVGVLGTCVDNAYTCAASETGQTCTDYETGMVSICKKQKECRSVAASGYTGYGAIVLHAFVFVLLALAINISLRRGGFY